MNFGMQIQENKWLKGRNLGATIDENAHTLNKKDSECPIRQSQFHSGSWG